MAVESFALLNQPTMVARPLPVAPGPEIPTIQEGQYTVRLNDAGDGQITFPNAIASDGVAWRDRFDPYGHNQWIEIVNDGYLSQNFCVVTATKTMSSIVVAGGDGMWLLKKAYERDWVFTGAPRDVIERASMMWNPLVADNFLYMGSTIPDSQWNTSTAVEVTTHTGTGANDSGIAGTAWTNPTNITSGGASAATFAVTGPQTPPFTGLVYSQGLRATNFGFSIPSDATIVGIQAGWETKITDTGASGSGWGMDATSLVVGGVLTSNHASTGSGDFFPSGGAEVWGYNGSANDLWGATLAYTDVNASNFGVEINTNAGVWGDAGTITMFVYDVQMSIWYTESGSSAVQIQTTNGVAMSVTSTPGNTAEITSNAIPTSSPVWASEASFSSVVWGGASGYLLLRISEDSVYVAALTIGANGSGYLYGYDPGGVSLLARQQIIPSTPTYSLRLESDGEWLWGFINGQFVGCVRRPTSTPSTITTDIALISQGATANVVMSSVLTEAQEPFLMQSAATQELCDGECRRLR